MAVNYIDYNILEDRDALGGQDIVIYGAGRHARQVAQMLGELGCSRWRFFDGRMDGGSFLVIPADDDSRKEAEHMFAHMDGVKFLSFFGLRTFWKYMVNDYTHPNVRRERELFWQKILAYRISCIQKACESPVVVYQCGKVGSTSVSQGLSNAGVLAAQVHGFLFSSDTVKELVVSAAFDDRTPGILFGADGGHSEYLRVIREKMRGRKIITLVREPVAVDFSKAAQWMGNGIADEYFAGKYREGGVFSEIFTELLLKTRNQEWEWFDEELKEVTGVDVFLHPFDREKGYARIRGEQTEILVLKSEKLADLEDVVRDFTGNEEFKILQENKGEDKEYSYIYRELQRKIVLPEDYLGFYYKNHPAVEHFYTDKEKEGFLRKWGKDRNL